MESIIRDHIAGQLNNSAGLSASQHGFTKGRSCAPTPGRCFTRTLASSEAAGYLQTGCIVLTPKVWTTATPTYLSELVQTRAPPRALRSSDARRS